MGFAFSILLHCTTFPTPLPTQIGSLNYVNWFTESVYGALGYFGMPIVFVVAGALLLNPQKPDEPAHVFFKRWFNRLALPLVFWTATYLVWSWYIQKEQFTVLNFTKNLIAGGASVWYLYVLVVLLAVTPILRAMVKNISRNLFTYLLVLWFAGTTIPPLLSNFTGFYFDPEIVVFAGWVGYFLLGAYLLQTKISRTTAFLIATVGVLGATLGDWWVYNTNQNLTGYFHHYASFATILGAIGVFLFLKNTPAKQIFNGGKRNRVIRWIGKNALPIYLIHVMVLEGLMPKLFSYIPTTSIRLINDPMWFVATFATSVVIVFLLKKIPFITRLIG